MQSFKEIAFTVGFRAATVDELSARAGVSKRTIYRYFRSKDEMIGVVMDDFMLATEKNIKNAMAGTENPAQKIVNLVRITSQNLKLISPVIMRDMKKYYPHVWNKIEKFRADRAQSVIEEILSSGIRQGHFRETVPEVFITAFLAGVRDVLNPGFILENNLTVEKAMLCLSEIFLYGIVTSPP